MDWFQRLAELLRTPGVVGYEEEVRRKIQEWAQAWAEEVRIDPLGNLLLGRKGEREGHLAFFAHMDEVGLTVTNIDPQGFLYFKKLGGIDDRVLPSRHVRLITQQGKEVAGVIGWRPPHLMLDPAKEGKEAVPWHELTIDVGAGSREEARDLGIEVGDPVVFTKELSRLANDRAAGRGMDDRVGCVVLLEVMRRLEGEGALPRLTFAFTTQEEYGLRGAAVAGYDLRPDLAFAIDTISAPDFPQAPQPFKDQIALGKGPVLRLVDNQMVAHQPTRRWVEAVAREMGIGYQVAVTGGTTDAAALQLAQQGLSVLPLCIPCRYTHSTVEVVSLKDIEDSIRLLLQVIRAFGSTRPKGLNDT